MLAPKQTWPSPSRRSVTAPTPRQRSRKPSNVILILSMPTRSAVVLEEGLRRSPRAWRFYYQLGIAHYGLGDYNRAEEEYLKAESLNPEPPAEIHVKLADVYLKKSAFDKAHSEMQSYVHAEPGGRFAAKVRELMKQLESAGLVHVAQDQPPQDPKP